MKKIIKTASFSFVAIALLFLILGAIQNITNNRSISILGLFFKKTNISTYKSSFYTFFRGDSSYGVDVYFIADDNCYTVNKDRSESIPYFLNLLERKKSSSFSLISLCFPDFSSAHLASTLPILLSRHTSIPNKTRAFIQIGINDVEIKKFKFEEKEMGIWQRSDFVESDLWRISLKKNKTVYENLIDMKDYKNIIFIILKDYLALNVFPSKSEVLKRLSGISSPPALVENMIKYWQDGRYDNEIGEPLPFLGVLFFGLSYNDDQLESYGEFFKLIQNNPNNELMFSKNTALIKIFKKWYCFLDKIKRKQIFDQLKDGPLKVLFSNFEIELSTIYSQFEKNLDESIRILKEKQIKPILITYGIEGISSPNILVRAYAKKRDILLIDLAQEARNRNVDVRKFISFYGYLNTEGLKFYSQIISEHKNE